MFVSHFEHYEAMSDNPYLECGFTAGFIRLGLSVFARIAASSVIPAKAGIRKYSLVNNQSFIPCVFSTMLRRPKQAAKPWLVLEYT